MSQFMQQTTEADYIFRGIFFAGALTENTELVLRKTKLKFDIVTRLA